MNFDYRAEHSHGEEDIGNEPLAVFIWAAAVEGIELPVANTLGKIAQEIKILTLRVRVLLPPGADATEPVNSLVKDFGDDVRDHGILPNGRIVISLLNIRYAEKVSVERGEVFNVTSPVNVVDAEKKSSSVTQAMEARWDLVTNGKIILVDEVAFRKSKENPVPQNLPDPKRTGKKAIIPSPEDSLKDVKTVEREKDSEKNKQISKLNSEGFFLIGSTDFLIM